MSVENDLVSVTSTRKRCQGKDMELYRLKELTECLIVDGILVILESGKVYVA